MPLDAAESSSRRCIIVLLPLPPAEAPVCPLHSAGFTSIAGHHEPLNILLNCCHVYPNPPQPLPPSLPVPLAFFSPCVVARVQSSASWPVTVARSCGEDRWIKPAICTVHPVIITLDYLEPLRGQSPHSPTSLSNLASAPHRPVTEDNTAQYRSFYTACMCE